MKKSVLIIASILISNFGFSQINPTNVSQGIKSIDMESGINKHITWNTEKDDFGLIGHRIINDYNGLGFLYFQARHYDKFFNAMVINTKGYVGIGTSNPNELLTVRGTIYAQEVKVDLNVPADYVFQKYYLGYSILKPEYVIPSLEDLEVFIKKNHHLPEMPSAKDIQENGLQLKEMTNLLLQKVEELTLYTIEQQKRIQALEERLAKKQ